MKKRKYVYLLMSLLLLGTAGCGAQTTIEDETMKSSQILIQNETNKATATPTIMPTATPTVAPTTAPTPTIVISRTTKQKETPTKEELVRLNYFNRLLWRDEHC